MEIPGSLDFGLQDGVEVGVRHGGEGFVLFLKLLLSVPPFFFLGETNAYFEYHGALYAAFDGRHCFKAVVQCPFQCGSVAHIAGWCCNIDTLSLQLLYQNCSCFPNGIGTPH